ncbi:hypothetical protein [Rhodoferax saidenbachensis]|uniref:Type II/III secretion system secretin-like domain-containing protein n=1 Tax=Rhodoferax saidenbachensis TaxID=1484693 RepID=A0ABU1ZT25_9BURK|nr:hypothetical protein [Rhodoferax saidenbachensis]MDR7308712.1 hypothetical protein [Rhodoferax saidenbachensis]
MAWGAGAWAALPQRDLTVELRQVEEGREDGTSYRAGPGASAPLVPQKIQVRNGEKGTLRTNQLVPMQWVSSVQAPSRNSGAGVSQSLHWLDVGQTLTVTPRWPGGKKEATVELDMVQTEAVTDTNADMPRQSRKQITTTVTTPLGEWVTIAASGNAAPKQGSYSSEGSTGARWLLQIRVLAP